MLEHLRGEEVGQGVGLVAAAVVPIEQVLG